MLIEKQAISFQSDGLLLRGSLVYPLPKNGYFGVLCIHGSSKSSDNRFLVFQEFLAQNGYASLQFFCRGVGGSAGKYEEASLNNRLQDGLAALKFFRESGLVDPNNIAVLGVSMGGHVAVRLMEKEKKIKTLLLYCPAAYALAAENVPLNEAFTKVITVKESWVNSPVWDILGKYKGTVLVAYGTKDIEIPDGVKERYKQALKNGNYWTLEGGQHKLLVATNDQEEQIRRELFKTSLNFLNLSFR